MEEGGGEPEEVSEESSDRTAEVLRHEDAGSDTSDLLFISGTLRTTSLVLHGGDKLLQFACFFFSSLRTHIKFDIRFLVTKPDSKVHKLFHRRHDVKCLIFANAAF